MSRPLPEALRGVIAGLGVMGGHHLRVLHSLPDVDVVAVADPNPQRREAASRGNVPRLRAHATLTEALAAHELDFACIATPADRLRRRLRGARGGARDAGREAARTD